jgi:hypothetical protein
MAIMIICGRRFCPPVRCRSSALSIQLAGRTDREQADATATALESERPAHRPSPLQPTDEQERRPAVLLVDEGECGRGRLSAR